MNHGENSSKTTRLKLPISTYKTDAYAVDDWAGIVTFNPLAQSFSVSEKLSVSTSTTHRCHVKGSDCTVFAVHRYFTLSAIKEKLITDLAIACGYFVAPIALSTPEGKNNALTHKYSPSLFREPRSLLDIIKLRALHHHHGLPDSLIKRVQSAKNPNTLTPSDIIINMGRDDRLLTLNILEEIQQPHYGHIGQFLSFLLITGASDLNVGNVIFNAQNSGNPPYFIDLEHVDHGNQSPLQKAWTDLARKRNLNQTDIMPVELQQYAVAQAEHALCLLTDARIDQTAEPILAFIDDYYDEGHRGQQWYRRDLQRYLKSIKTNRDGLNAFYKNMPQP